MEPEWEEASPAGGQRGGAPGGPQPSSCPHTIPGFLGTRGLYCGGPQIQHRGPSGTQSLGGTGGLSLYLRAALCPFFFTNVLTCQIKKAGLCGVGP